MSEFDPMEVITREFERVGEKIADDVKKEISNIAAAAHGNGIEARAHEGMREVTAPEQPDAQRAGHDIPAYRPQLETDGPWPFPNRPDNFPGTEATSPHAGETVAHDREAAQHGSRPA